MSEKKKYDSTVARVAGNLLSGNPYILSWDENDVRTLVARAVRAARMIVEETERTERVDKDL